MPANTSLEGDYLQHLVVKGDDPMAEFRIDTRAVLSMDFILFLYFGY